MVPFAQTPKLEIKKKMAVETNAPAKILCKLILLKMKIPASAISK